MADLIQSKGGGYRAYGYNAGRDLNFTPQHFASTGMCNMVRNSSFLSWSQGTSGYPDAWEWDSIGTISRDGSLSHWGNYALKIAKINTDGAVTRVYQDLTYNPTTAEIEGKSICFSMWMKTDEGSTCMRPFIYDGANYKYGPTYTGDNEWQRAWLTQYFDTAPTALKVGVEVEETAETSTVYYYADAAFCSWGIYPPWYSEHPDDRSIICQDWDDDGTQVIVRGCMRAVPFEVEHTTTAGRLQTCSVVLDYGCDEIVHVTTNMVATTVANFFLIQHNSNNYSTTGFDISIYNASWASFGAGDTITINGVAWCIGWDTPSEQWK